MKLAIAIIAVIASASAAEAKPCPRIAKPVCVLKGTTRSTVNNACMAENGGASVLHDGACEGGDMCSMIYTPVCAIDPATGNEKTYSSVCVSEHADAKITHNGACEASKEGH